MSDELGEQVARLYLIYGGGRGLQAKVLERKIADLYKKHLLKAMAEAWMNGVLFSYTREVVYEHDNPYRTEK